MTKEDTVYLGICALLYQRKQLQRWMKETKGDTLMLDEDKASALFPWLIAGLFDEQLLEDVVGISHELIQTIRETYLN